MTELLERALEAVRRMAPTEQDVIAGAILGLAKLSEDDATLVDDDELREAMEVVAEVERGEIATSEEIAAAWRSFER